MADKLHEQLNEYDRALALAHTSYIGITRDERAARDLAAKQLEQHAPSNRTNPTCTGCDGGTWPCGTARGAMVMADSRHN